MTLASISPRELSERIGRGESLTLLDVRTSIEFAEVHARGARNVPLDTLDPRAIAADGPIFVLCKSGARAARACGAFAAAGVGNVFHVDGGTDAWVRAGLPVERNKNVISLERQVRIVAGLLVLIGVILGMAVHPGFFGLSAFVGAGLVFAGVTNFCGMAMLLAKAPWNRGSAKTV